MIDDRIVPAATHTDEAADVLAGLPLLESVPRDEIVWLAGRGELRRYAEGDVIRSPGEAIDEMNASSRPGWRTS